MKMRHELIAVCYKLNDVVGQKVRLNRRNSISLNACYLFQLLDERVKIFSFYTRKVRGLTEISKINAGQYDLLYALCGQVFCIFDYMINGITPAFPSCQRNRAERATIITTILHL